MNTKAESIKMNIKKKLIFKSKCIEGILLLALILLSPNLYYSQTDAFQIHIPSLSYFTRCNTHTHTINIKKSNEMAAASSFAISSSSSSLSESDRIKKAGCGLPFTPAGNCLLFNPEEAGKLQGTGSLSLRIENAHNYVLPKDATIHKKENVDSKQEGVSSVPLSTSQIQSLNVPQPMQQVDSPVKPKNLVVSESIAKPDVKSSSRRTVKQPQQYHKTSYSSPKTIVEPMTSQQNNIIITTRKRTTYSQSSFINSYNRTTTGVKTNYFDKNDTIGSTGVNTLPLSSFKEEVNIDDIVTTSSSTMKPTNTRTNHVSNMSSSPSTSSSTTTSKTGLQPLKGTKSNNKRRVSFSPSDVRK